MRNPEIVGSGVKIWSEPGIESLATSYVYLSIVTFSIVTVSIVSLQRCERRSRGCSNRQKAAEIA